MVLKGWSIPAGRWLGINVRIHFTFFFLLVFIGLTQSQNLEPKIALARSVGFLGIVFGSVVLHELAHFLLAKRSGQLPRSLVLLPIGGLAMREPVAESGGKPGHDANAWQEIRIAAAGPLANLLLAAAALACMSVFYPLAELLRPPWAQVGNLPRALLAVNVFLAVLNLLPAYPLDGGRVLRALLAQRLDHFTAARRASNLGNVFVILLMFAGLWNTWFMLAGFFLFVAAQLEERTVLFQSVLENVSMEEVMLTDFATLSPADTLEDALSKAVHTLQDDFPVVRGNDMVGVVTRQKILQALRRQGNAYVQSIMNRAYEVAGRHDSLASAFRKITARHLTIIPVVDQERLVGIVTLQNLMHSMGVLAESRKLQRSEGSIL